MKRTKHIQVELRYKSGRYAGDDYGRSYKYTREIFDELVQFVKLKKKYDVIHDSDLHDNELVVMKMTLEYFDPNEK